MTFARPLRRRAVVTALLLAALAVACSDDEPTGSTDAASDATDTDAASDADDPSPDAAPDGLDDLVADAADDAVGDTSEDADDAEVDAGPRTWDFAVGAPFAPPEADVLAGTELESCAVYAATRCDDSGNAWECAVYDASLEDFVAEGDLDPLYAKVLWFERWYDLYSQPDGQTSQREFTTPMAAGTPESVWGDPANFSRYDGIGDAAIWTGVALNAYLLRYLATGTEADYARFETKVRQLVRLFDVTGVPGYLARHHFLLLPEGAPRTDAQIVLYGEADDHRDRAIPDPEDVPGLPDLYLDGLTDDEGTTFTGTPMWHGNPSIDQYTGPMVTFPAVYSLVRDPDLRDRLAHHLVCYLNRLQRIELIHLQDNPQALEAARTLLAGGALNLDEDDIDFTELDTIVAFAHRQLNDVNDATFDTSCPDGPPREPWRVIDATDPSFTLDLIELFSDLQSGTNERFNGIDHLYAPSVRGGDAVHMMHLAAMAWHFTGDDTYAAFLQDDLLGDIRADEVAQTLGALVLPAWCRAFYGDHITIPPLWALINLLRDSPLRDEMLSVFEREAWEKDARSLGNAVFDLLYAGVVPTDLAVDHDLAVERALTALTDIGGNGGVEVDPRRNYSLPYDTVVSELPEGIERTCPTPEQRATCEDGFSLLGLTIPGEDISPACTGAAGECDLGEGQCARPMASAALPVDLRVYSDFIWQRNPFEMGRIYGLEGTEQSPSLDVIEIFWLARHYGFTDAGEGEALAWRPVGTCGD